MKRYAIFLNRYGAYETRVKYPWWPWWLRIDGLYPTSTLDLQRARYGDWAAERRRVATLHKNGNRCVQTLESPE